MITIFHNTLKSNDIFTLTNKSIYIIISMFFCFLFSLFLFLNFFGFHLIHIEHHIHITIL